MRRHGQRWFARLAHAAGADGVEVRGELLMGDEEELRSVGACVRESSMLCVYSSPEGLWTGDGALDHAALERAIDAALRLGAPRLKMSIGGFREESAMTLPRTTRPRPQARWPRSSASFPRLNRKVCGCR